MPTDIARAAAQLTDPRIRGVLAKSLAGTLIIFVLLWVGIGYLLAHLVLSQAWLHWIIEILGGLATLVLSWLLFPGIAGIVVGFFLDSVAEAVEARHYPGLPAARPQPLAELLREGLRFAGVSILLNLVALPVYLLIPAVNLFVFYGLNGYLLSREYFELVAVRRLAPSEARRLRRTYPGQILLMGVLIAFLLTVPVVNLIAPVFATALMVHVYHRLAGTPRGRRAP
ncbi:MAG TPA: EI24 domain-containing protein [Alphaproteobacteria bacterium]|nr:EI24 domain-containing protein [Alphaproteobacteria bacterium]